jgi:DNA-directed RNA polymerase specialized sigma subunit
MEALMKFDPSKGTPERAFVYKMIRNRMIDERRKLQHRLYEGDIMDNGNRQTVTKEEYELHGWNDEVPRGTSLLAERKLHHSESFDHTADWSQLGAHASAEDEAVEATELNEAFELFAYWVVRYCRESRRQTKKERNVHIVKELCIDKKTQTEVGEKYGIDQARVSQVARQFTEFCQERTT